MRSSFDEGIRLASDALVAPVVRLQPQQPPPPHYYAANLLAVVHTVVARYGDILTDVERGFGARIQSLSIDGQRLLARLIGRTRPLLREDSLNYPEVGDLPAALDELDERTLIDRCPAMTSRQILQLLTVDELRSTFWEVRTPLASKGERIERIVEVSPGRVCGWRIRRICRWLALRDVEQLQLYCLLFFGDRGQDLRTFVMRDLGIYRFEAVPLCKEARQFADRAMLDRFLELLRAQDEIVALGARPNAAGDRAAIADLIDRLWHSAADRMLERRRSRALNRLGRNLERVGAFDMALTCYRRSTLAPARERRMRILHRLQDSAGVEALRSEIAVAPQTTLEADFASRFERPFRRPSLPVWQQTLNGGPSAPTAIEQHALRLLTADGGVGWHLENNLPMAIFALAYWEWLFAPVQGAFVNAFQTGPVDLFWPDFFAARKGRCQDPLDGALLPRLRSTIGAKADVANRLFNWRRFTPAVANAIFDAIPEEDLRALLAIVRDDLSGRRSGFPDLTVVYGPGRYEFVEVKGPTDQLQIHQRLWIQALQERHLPVRVLRFRPSR